MSNILKKYFYRTMRAEGWKGEGEREGEGELAQNCRIGSLRGPT